MSVYDELMNEAPTLPPTQHRGQTSISNKQRVQQSLRALGTTAQSRRDSELMFKKQSGTQGPGKRQARVYGGASDNPLQQAAGTTYEGPSLREKVEYIARFLEEGKRLKAIGQALNKPISPRLRTLGRRAGLAAATALLATHGGITNVGDISGSRKLTKSWGRIPPPRIVAPETPGKASKTSKPNADDLVQKINKDYRQSKKIARSTKKDGEKNK